VACIVVGAGLAIWFGMLSAKAPPRIPGQGSAGAGAALPEGHPPLEVSAEVREKIEALDRQAKANPDDIEVWKQLGRAQYSAAQVDPHRFMAAAAAYDHVLEKKPDDLEALRMRGNIDFDMRRPREAIEFYKRYLALSPDDPSVTTDMATMYLAADDTAKAIELYKQVLAADPNYFQAQLNLAVAYRASGQTEEEKVAVEKALKLAPDEQTRKRLAAILSAPTPPAPATPSSTPQSGFRPDVESIFRGHQVMGEKVEQIAWPDDRTIRVTLRDFPMNAMPPTVLEAFDKRIKEELKARKEAYEVKGEVRVELVDAATGKVMETITD